MEKVTNKEILERTGLPSVDRLLELSTLNCLLVKEREGGLTSLNQGYHQEKLEGERHKDQLMDITLTVER